MDPTTPSGDALSPPARVTRLIVTVLGTVLLLAGSLWGSDDNFPFGPFSMFAGVNRLDDPAPDTRVEATDRGGATITLTERNTGVRRAEIEGQIARFRADPTLLRAVAQAYQQRNPAAPELVTVTVVIRWYELAGGEPTGVYRDEVAATWHS